MDGDGDADRHCFSPPRLLLPKGGADFRLVRCTSCLHLYSLPGVDETYEFNDDSYAALAAAGIAWQDVIYVLHDSRPKVRRHIGSVLNIAARDRRGSWIAVASLESADDEYLVRPLDSDEVTTVTAMLKGQL